MGGFFNAILYQPLYNVLIWLYNVIPGADMGAAIIVLTLLVKALTWPLTHSSLTSQKAMQELQPKLDALKVQYGDDKEKLAKATMELYTTEKVNPLSSCLPVLIQLPFIIALYAVLRAGLKTESLTGLYPFVHNPGTINDLAFGFLDLTKKSIPIGLVAGVCQFFQTKMLISRRPPPAIREKPGVKDEDALATMNKSMMYTMPVMTAVIGSTLPAGLALYWVTVNLITIAQQAIAFRKKN
jgi:YidC/Oxa1 family membrane protein insertase